MLQWVGYWLAIALFVALFYLGIGLFRFERRLQHWEAVGLALVCLFFPPALLVLLVYLAVRLMRWRRGIENWERLAIALFLAAAAASALDVGGQALEGPGLSVLAWALAPIMVLLYFFLFSDGRFTTRNTRWLAILYGLTQIGHLWAGNSSSQSGGSDHVPAVLINIGLTAGNVAVVALAMVGIASQIYARHRHLAEAGPRLPVRWSVLGSALAVGVAVVVIAALLFSPPYAARTLLPPAGRAVAYLVLTLVPLAISFAVLQRRPYDREALLNRTLVYGALTVCLVLIYVGITAPAARIFGEATGAPQLAVLLATLIMAALFRPLRGWLQQGVDRWLFPRKYAADRVLDEVGAALPSEIHLDQLSDHLIAAIQQAMRPVVVTLWVRTAPSLSAQAVERMLPPGASAGAGAGGGQTQPQAQRQQWEMEARRLPGESGAQTPIRTLVVEPGDAIRAALPQTAGVADVDQLPADSAAVRALKASGTQVALSLASEGELLGVLGLGPRTDGARYSFDDRELLETLATRVTPALRVALLVHEQDVETNGRARIEQELSTARRIQLTLLPKQIPRLAGWQLAAYYQPAREVGGDFYDFLPFADGRLGLVLGDVTDKGVPAALVMATTRSMVRAAAQDSTPPGAVLARVNDLLQADLPPSMFVTCFYAILDPRSGRLRFANAGQDLPYVRRADGVVDELRARGMPLGLMPAMDYEERETDLRAGDSVLFYSDGLVEAHDARREMFGLPRLKALLAGQTGERRTIDVLLDELAAFTGAGWEQEDDVTLVTLRREEG